MDVLSEFDRAVAERRKELIEEFQIEGDSEPVEAKGKPADSAQAQPTDSTKTESDAQPEADSKHNA